LKAKANSRNPKTTFTVFNHPPDLGENSSWEHSEKHKVKLMPMKNPMMGAPLEAASTNKVPTIGPVQEKIQLQVPMP
jgi:hypothetical protein